MTFNQLHKLEPWALVVIYERGFLVGHMWAETAIAIYQHSTCTPTFSLSNHNGVTNMLDYWALQAKRNIV